MNKNDYILNRRFARIKKLNRSWVARTDTPVVSGMAARSYQKRFDNLGFYQQDTYYVTHSRHVYE